MNVEELSSLDKTIKDFMTTFYGYGEPKGEYWFVGKEEGDSGSIRQNLKRILQWEHRGKKAFEDLSDFHRVINEERWFGEKPKIQPTWNKLIRLVLKGEGQPVNVDSVRSYQRNNLGRIGKDTCLLELLPLPSQSTSKWEYSGITSIAYLQSRSTYREKIAGYRALKIKELIENYKPKVVVFYSTDKWYLDTWKKITGNPFTNTYGYLTSKNSKTNFFVVPHPTSHGTSNQFFEDIGKQIAAISG